ncbi:hypothetical protein KC906_01385 [Candidatus Kaiserbacteria bacterium]|nr:hypothetical protein [Candidatus Kaiserbacteria bacterium]MCB9812417.1 hypothetical protein [Candidatus Nomurabacteria bacterium]
MPQFWILGFTGVAYCIYLLEQPASVRSKAFGVWLAWVVKSGCAVWWMWSVYPIEWLPASLGQIQMLLIGFSWLMTAVSLGAGALVLVSGRVGFTALGKLPKWSYHFLIYPLLWVIGEMVGSLLFSIFFYGPGGTIGTDFSFGYVGYLIAQHQWFIQVAQLAGVYGLSILIVVLAGGVVWWMQTNTVKPSWLVAIGLSLYLTGFVAWPTPTVSPVNNGYEVAFIETSFESRMFLSEDGVRAQRMALEDAMNAALASGATYIILPEDSRYFDQSRSPSATRLLFALRHDDPEVVIVDSARAVVGGQTVQQAFVYNGPQETVDRFHKRYLVPQGEYISSIYIKLFELFGMHDSLKYLGQDISYEVGPWTNQSTGAKNIPAILFCFESFAPKGMKVLQAERPDMPFTVHIASHAWFHEPNSLWSQMEAMLKVQVIWTQQYLVSVGNMVESNIYTPQGQVLDGEVFETGEQWQVKLTTLPR